MPNLETPVASIEVPVLPTAPADAAPGAPPAEQRLLLRGLDWASYRKISEALTGIAVQLAYDRGGLEFMTTSRQHEIFSRCLGLLIAVLAEEMNLPLDGCGSMTCDREDLERGIEPDECFYITHEPAVRGKAKVDLSADPPPDLGIEVDISRSSLVRMPIYAALGVPEVWRFDGQVLTFYHLGTDQQYVEAKHSLYFTGITAAHVLPFVRQRTQADEIAVVRSFRSWLREQIAKAKDKPGLIER